MVSSLHTSFGFTLSVVRQLINPMILMFSVIVGVILLVYLIVQLLYLLARRYNFHRLIIFLDWIDSRPLWIKDLFRGSFLLFFAWLFISSFFYLLGGHIPSSVEVYSWGYPIPTPFIGNLSVSDYVELVNWILGLYGFIALCCLLLGSIFIAFSFGNRFIKGIGILLFLLVFFFFFVAMYFQAIVNGLTPL